MSNQQTQKGNQDDDGSSSVGDAIIGILKFFGFVFFIPIGIGIVMIALLEPQGYNLFTGAIISILSIAVVFLFREGVQIVSHAFSFISGTFKFIGYLITFR